MTLKRVLGFDRDYRVHTIPLFLIPVDVLSRFWWEPHTRVPTKEKKGQKILKILKFFFTIFLKIKGELVRDFWCGGGRILVEISTTNQISNLDQIYLFIGQNQPIKSGP